jgi:hydroxyacylglutathione hydrolase
VPSTLGLEKRTNPFLRCDEPALAAAVEASGSTPAEVFALLRSRKDAF